MHGRGTARLGDGSERHSSTMRLTISRPSGLKKSKQPRAGADGTPATQFWRVRGFGKDRDGPTRVWGWYNPANGKCGPHAFEHKPSCQESVQIHLPSDAHLKVTPSIHNAFRRCRPARGWEWSSTFAKVMTAFGR